MPALDPEGHGLEVTITIPIKRGLKAHYHHYYRADGYVLQLLSRLKGD